MTLQERRRLTPPGTQWLEPGTLSTDGIVLSLCTGAGPVVLLDTATGGEIQRVRSVAAIHAAYSPASHWVATQDRENDQLFVRSLDRPADAMSLDLPLANAAISPDGCWLLGSSSRQHKMIKLSSAGAVETFPAGGSEFHLGAAAAWSPDGQLVALVTERGQIELRRAGTWEHVLWLKSPQPANLTGLAFSPDQRHLAAATSEEQIEIWDFDEIRSELAALDLHLPALLRATRAKTPPIDWPSSRVAIPPASPPTASVSTFPPRPGGATSRQIDLSGHYNLLLAAASPFDAALTAHLGSLPSGLQQFDGIVFDVRGAVQLQGLNLAKSHPEFPPAVTGIHANVLARHLHFLGALIDLQRQFPLSVTVGRCVVHYEDGRRAEFPWRAWQDFDDVWVNPRTIREHSESNVVWTGMDPDAEAANCRVRLMKATWENPRPETRIISMDLISDKQTPAPFIVAITAE